MQLQWLYLAKNEISQRSTCEAITKMAQGAGLWTVLCLVLWDAGNEDRLCSSGLGDGGDYNTL